MTINNRGLAGQPNLPYVDNRAYAGTDMFFDFTFLDHTMTDVVPFMVAWQLDDITNDIGMVPCTHFYPSTGGPSPPSAPSVFFTLNAGFSAVFAGYMDANTAAFIFDLGAIGSVSGTLLGLTIGAFVTEFIAGENTTTLITYGTAPVAPFALPFTDSHGNPQNLLSTAATVTSITVNGQPATQWVWNPSASYSIFVNGGIYVIGTAPPVPLVPPYTYTLQIPGSTMQMSYPYQGSQLCQLSVAATITDTVTGNTSTRIVGLAILELVAIQTPNGFGPNAGC